MTLKEFVTKILSGDQEYKRNFIREQQARKIDRTLNERAKNANERELERFIEEDRQKRIKIALEKYRKEKKKEYFSSTPINKGWDTLKSKNKILKQKHIFKGNGGKATILRGSLSNKVK